jgi:hypothetical protein
MKGKFTHFATAFSLSAEFCLSSVDGAANSNPSHLYLGLQVHPLLEEVSFCSNVIQSLAGLLHSEAKISDLKP